MSTENATVDTKVETVNIDIDEIFGADASSITVPDESEKKPNMFTRQDKVDFTFTEPTEEKTTEETKVVSEEITDVTEAAEDAKEAKTETTEAVNDVFEALNEDPQEEKEDKPKRGRKTISGISDVFTKLIKEDKIVPFDDDKPLDEYSAKDFEELIEANLEERANQVRNETPRQFFESLPTELQIAARYVADGGQDMKGLFATLASVEESRALDVKSERDQVMIITEYLKATGFGNDEEIKEEIEVWADLGNLEKQASKFKPKLDKMQEKVVARKLQEQEMRKAQQENASKQYMHSVYETLKEGTLGEIKLDKKTQSMLYNGLVQPSYPSVSGKNTNLLGHLLEKYQFVEPNYTLISEALWLLSDPNGYKAKVMEKGAQGAVEKTVRKLKTEQSNTGGSSLGVQQEEKNSKSSKRKIPRATNIFKRI
jgi:hypothetical protein